MVSKYLTHNCLCISNPVAIAKVHSLFVANEKTKPLISRYQKSHEEVIAFLTR